MSELKRHAPFHDIEDGAYMSELPKGEYVRFKDMQATVQPLVDALERAECELLGWIVAHDRHEDRVAVKGIQAALAAYREATGVEK